MKFEMKLEPGAHRFIRDLSNPEKLSKAKRRINKILAFDTAVRVRAKVGHLLPPDEPGTVQQKGHASTGIETKAYLNSIAPAPAEGTSYGVVADIRKALLLELGTVNQDARPHWEPVLRFQRSRLGPLVNDIMIKSVFG